MRHIGNSLALFGRVEAEVEPRRRPPDRTLALRNYDREPDREPPDARPVLPLPSGSAGRAPEAGQNRA